MMARAKKPRTGKTKMGENGYPVVTVIGEGGAVFELDLTPIMQKKLDAGEIRLVDPADVPAPVAADVTPDPDADAADPDATQDPPESNDDDGVTVEVVE